ncbi:MAG: hypothetical protein KA248_13855 [Kiritimatiellae bacterium]|nr:hypothetical protein [Kiritimatiellia bacterium]
MGHVRLGALPHTKRWTKIVDLITTGADAAKVAKATIEASQKALTYVQGDAGFREAVQLLVEIGQAGSQKDPAAYLAKAGIQLPSQPSLTDVAVGIAQALERRINSSGKQSEFGEKARSALVGAVTEHIEKRMGTLLSGAGEDAALGLKGLHTEKGFGELGRSFFSKLTYGCMDWFLSRTLSAHVGAGQRFATMNQLAQFESALKTHCEESSVIVQDYCGEWFAKHRYTEGGRISGKSIDGFGWFGVEKMRGEFAFEGKGDGD